MFEVVCLRLGRDSTSRWSGSGCLQLSNSRCELAREWVKARTTEEACCRSTSCVYVLSPSPEKPFIVPLLCVYQIIRWFRPSSMLIFGELGIIIWRWGGSHCCRRVTEANRRINMSWRWFLFRAATVNSVWSRSGGGSEQNHQFSVSVVSTPVCLIHRYEWKRNVAHLCTEPSVCHACAQTATCFTLSLLLLFLSLHICRSSWSRSQEGNRVSRSHTRKPKTAPV